MDTDTRSERGIGVLIVCPHRLEREALGLAVERDHEMRVVGLANGASPQYLAGHVGTDVVVIGWGWQERECLDLLQSLLSERAALPVVVISADTRVERIQRAIEAGARGFLPANVDLDDLLHAIRTAFHDDQVGLHRTLAPAFLSHLAARSGSRGPQTLFDSLTPREQEVVRLLAEGLADRDLAQRLFISVRTVQTHLSHIYAKVGVHTRTEVALMAVREGWAPVSTAEGAGDESP